MTRHRLVLVVLLCAAWSLGCETGLRRPLDAEPRATSENARIVAPAQPAALSEAASATAEGSDAATAPPRERASDAGVAATETGPHDAGDGGVEAVVARLRPGFRRCYKMGLQRDPRMEGMLTVTAHLSPSGAVSETEITRREGLDDGVCECIRDLIANATFANAWPETKVLQVPVKFVQQRAAPDAGVSRAL